MISEPRSGASRHAGQPLRLAMIESHYPRATGTFYQREIDGLAAHGVEIQTFVLMPYEAVAWQDPAVLALTGGRPPERARVHYAQFPMSWAVWRSNFRALCRKPRRYLGTLATLLLHLSPRPLVSAKMLVSFAKGVYFAEAADRLEVDHLCAFWANHCATAAYVMSALMENPIRFSAFAHAGTDLYRDQSFLRQKLRAAAAVFAVSDFNRRWLGERYPEIAPKIQVHHLGLDLDQYAYDPSPRTGRTIVAVGSLERVKGFHILIEACARLRERGVEFRCELLGEGPQRPDLTRRIRRYGLERWVTLRGQCPHPEVIARMRAARLLVHPSTGLGDGVPTVIKEAAAIGTPVVATRVVGIPELVIEEKTGLLVPPNDPEALAAAIARMMDEPGLSLRLAAAGRAHAERLFDLQANTADLARYLRALAAPPRAEGGAAADALAPAPMPLAQTARSSERGAFEGGG